jgi:hypothetical protein
MRCAAAFSHRSSSVDSFAWMYFLYLCANHEIAIVAKASALAPCQVLLTLNQFFPCCYFKDARGWLTNTNYMLKCRCFFFYLPSTASTYTPKPILKGLSGTGEQLSCNHKFRDNFWPCIAGCLLYNHIFSCDFGGLFGVILCLVKVMNLSIGCDVQTKARASHRFEWASLKHFKRTSLCVSFLRKYGNSVAAGKALLGQTIGIYFNAPRHKKAAYCFKKCRCCNTLNCWVSALTSIVCYHTGCKHILQICNHCSGLVRHTFKLVVIKDIILSG